jgi:hypothetical protein
MIMVRKSSSQLQAEAHYQRGRTPAPFKAKGDPDARASRSTRYQAEQHFGTKDPSGPIPEPVREIDYDQVKAKRSDLNKSLGQLSDELQYAKLSGDDQRVAEIVRAQGYRQAGHEYADRVEIDEDVVIDESDLGYLGANTRRR